MTSQLKSHESFLSWQLNIAMSVTLQRACKIDAQYITNFGEEVVRGQPLFVLSIILQFLDPILRKSAELGAWQVNSWSIDF